MDVGLLILGLIILFGASILFKAAGFDKGGTTTEVSTAPIGAKTIESRQIEQGVEKPQTTPPKKEEESRICRNCLAKNPLEATFCNRCGKNLMLELPSNINKQKLWFRDRGWSKNPFTLDVIPALFTGYEKEVKSIMKMVGLHSGHILITGDIGVGKTTILKWLELNIPPEFNPMYVFHPPKDFQEIIDTVKSKMDIKEKCTLANIDKVLMGQNKSCILLLDEAHEFDESTIKSFKTLGDAEGVSLILAGIPKVEDLIRKRNPALLNRIVFKLKLGNLNLEHSTEMIAKRIVNVGGSEHEPFTGSSISKIYGLCGGNPRNIIKLCNSAVALAIDKGVSVIDENLIVELGN